MLKNLKNRIADLEKDDLLEAIGLEERRSTAERLLPSLALFGAGMLLGVGLGLMLAPKPGRELREDLKQRLGKGGDATATPANGEATPDGTRAS